MQHVDFFSLGMKGSELSVLQSIDFSKVSFGFLLIEHSSDALNEKGVRQLLEANNYDRINFTHSPHLNSTHSLNALVDQDQLFKYRGRRPIGSSAWQILA